MLQAAAEQRMLRLSIGVTVIVSAVGVLFGLFNWRFEILAMMQHSAHLEQRFGCGPHTISVPIWSMKPKSTGRPSSAAARSKSRKNSSLVAATSRAWGTLSLGQPDRSGSTPMAMAATARAVRSQCASRSIA